MTMTKGKKIFWWILIPVIVLVLIGVVIWLKEGMFSKSESYNSDYDYTEGGYVSESKIVPGVLPSPSTSSYDDITRDFKDGDVYEEKAPMDSVAGNSDSSSVASDRLIIKTGSLSIVVKDVKEAVKIVSDYATKNGGFVVYSNVYKSGLSPYAEISIRIPSENFAKGVESVKAVGEVTSESVSGQDVTEEFVDLEARLNNLRATEAQYLEIMKKAVKIEDVLAVQNELTYTREEIERIEGRMKYLEESAALSTLTVYLSTDPSALPAVDNENIWKPFAVVKEAFRTLVDMGKSTVDGIIWFGVVILPIVIVVGFVAWILFLIGRGIYRRRKAKK